VDRFYEPFAEWLVKELEECTKAIAVGGPVFRDKWGTRDVVGLREPKKSDIAKFPPRSCPPKSTSMARA
jgi:hypothetical protein